MKTNILCSSHDPNKILRAVTGILAGGVALFIVFSVYNLTFSYSKITKIEMSHETWIDGKIIRYSWSINKDKLTPVFKFLVPDYNYSFELTFGHMNGKYYMNDRRNTFSFFSPKSGEQIKYFRFSNNYLPDYRYKLEGQSVELFNKLMNENRITLK